MVQPGFAALAEGLNISNLRREAGLHGTSFVSRRSKGLSAFPQVPVAIALVMIVLTVIVHVCFATAVVQDIGRGRQDGRNPWLVGTEIWALATLLGGILVVAIYWLMHHSSLNPQNDTGSASPNEPVP